MKQQYQSKAKIIYKEARCWSVGQGQGKEFKWWWHGFWRPLSLGFYYQADYVTHFQKYLAWGWKQRTELQRKVAHKTLALCLKHSKGKKKQQSKTHILGNSSSRALINTCCVYGYPRCNYVLLSIFLMKKLRLPELMWLLYSSTEPGCEPRSRWFQNAC